MAGLWEFWIDRNGTFTDVVARRPDGALITRKLLSDNPGQYPDAAVQGIRDCPGLTAGEPLPPIGAVKMGTTVATNALLVRRGERVLLLIIEGFQDLLRIDIRAVEVALMHGHPNPVHEARVGVLAREMGFTQVSLSHEVSRLARLAARRDTTVVDAYLSPILRRYVGQVAAALQIGQASGRPLFMQSSGGLTEATRFQGRDAILSGPAGGIVGMVKTGVAAGFGRLIGFDMGGTSTDVGHYAGANERSFDTEMAGVRMRAPMMDIHTAAAGGGSVCAFRDGRFQVGPDSAGANPGPASYRRGGPLTVTDCNVLLGRIQPAHFPAVFGPTGDQPLDAAILPARFAALAAEIAAATGATPLSPQAAAIGFLRIAVDNMANAIKTISVQRGHDVTGDTQQCFGGAGGQHACAVADAMGMTRVLLHPFAGVLSAFGMGLAEQRALREAQFDAPLSAIPEAAHRLAALQGQVRAELDAQGAVCGQVRTTAHLRYHGSHQTLEVPFSPEPAMPLAFEAAHLARFGFILPESDLLFDMLAVEAIGLAAPLPAMPVAAGDTAPVSHVPVWTDDWQDVPLFDRPTLPPGTALTGPAVVRVPTSTIYIAPGWQGRVDAAANLILERALPLTRSRAAGTAVDPVLLEVFNNLFMAVADQMGATLANTAWSVNIKERLDFFCAIFDGHGDLVANAPHVPVHLGSMSQAVKAMNNFVWGNDRFQNYETVCGGTGAGPGFPGCDAVQSHMTNTRMTDPEVLEKRFPVRLEALAIRNGSGGVGQWPGGNGVMRRLRFLEPVTVTTLCSSRLTAPFGMAGGGPGACGENRVIWPDGRVEILRGNDERNLPAGAVFEMLTPGGGGWGEADG